MNKAKKKAMYINITAQCVIYISAAVFSAANIFGVKLPDAVFIILMMLDLLTIPAFMYSYLKSMEGNSK